jgi:outer membrane receptor protein involved in Fe transport
VISFDTESSLLSPDGLELGVYFGDKMRLAERVAVDAGVRYDRQSYTDDSRFSPRAGIAFTPDDKTALRAAWGQYYQSQGIQELQVEDDDSAFRRASLSTHYMAGVERRFGRGTLVRVEGYYKDLSHIRDRFENIEDESDFLPEAEGDRVHVVPEAGSSQGLELFVRRDVGQVNWWFNYAFAKVDETHSSTNGYAGALGNTLPRRFDQRHSFSVDLIFRPKDNWHLGAGWEIRGGWPYTPKLVETATGADGEVVSRQFVTGGFLSDRYPVYHRLDAKISHWYDYGRVQMRFSFGLTNLYNRENVRRYSYIGPSGGGGGFQGGFGGGGAVQPADAFGRVSEGWLPSLPFVDLSLGF